MQERRPISRLGGLARRAGDRSSASRRKSEPGRRCDSGPARDRAGNARSQMRRNAFGADAFGRAESSVPKATRDAAASPDNYLDWMLRVSRSLSILADVPKTFAGSERLRGVRES